MLERRAMDLLDTRRPRALLVAFCLLLWLPGLFTLPPTDRDESRFAQATKQMIETGDYVRIMNGDEPRNRKPIGIHWLQAPFAAAARAVGIATWNPIWPYRLPSVLGGLLAVLAVERLGRDLVGPQAALLAAGMLAASVLLVVEVHLAKTDAALLGATTLCMGLLGRAYITPGRLGPWQAATFWLALAAGVLLKGPITPMVLGLTSGMLALWDRRAGWLLRLRPAWGVLLLLTAVLPWFAAIAVATHGVFFQDAIGGDLGRKLASGDNAHGALPGTHLLLLPLLAFPSSAAVLWGLFAAWRKRGEAGTRFLIAWAAPAWLVFELVPTKLPHYPLPVYPAIFLLGAQALLGVWNVPRWQVAFGHMLRWVAGGILAMGTLALPAVLGLGLWDGLPAALAVLLVTGLAGRRLGGALAAMPLFTLALLGQELPQALPLWIAPRVEQALTYANAGRLGAIGFHEPSLMFLAGTSTTMLADPADGARALTTGEVTALLVPDGDVAAFQAASAALGGMPSMLGKVSGFNYSKGHWVSLSIFVQ